MTESQIPPREGEGTTPLEGDIVARLLRMAGPRLDPPRETVERVKGVVHERWRQSVKARRRWRYLPWLAASLAAAAVLLVVAPLIRRGGPAPPAREEPAGTFVLGVGGLLGPGGAALRPGTAIRPGSALETAADARALLRLSMGATIRLDVGTRITLETGSRLHLERGAFYADSAAAAREGAGLEVRTGIGLVRDIGTRFEVRVQGRRLEVRVREGIVEVESPGLSRDVPSGTMLILDEAGNAQTGAVPPYGSTWDWTLEVAPEFALEGRTLGEFIEWVASETGLRVGFSDGVVDRDVAGIVLHGSIAGLRPDQAPGAVLPTCGLSHRVVGDTLVIAAAAAGDARR